MKRSDYERLYNGYTSASITSFKRDDSVILSEEIDFFDEAYTAEYSNDMLQQFKKGNLHLFWFWKYPHLFDRDDLWTGCAIQRESGNHFGEWLGAIILNHHYSHVSLVEKYDCPNEHKKKVQQTCSLLGEQTFKKLTESGSQPPDLLMYKDGDYFFCEVKRRNNKKKEKVTPNQPTHFRWLKEETGRKIILLALNEV